MLRTGGPRNLIKSEVVGDQVCPWVWGPIDADNAPRAEEPLGGEAPLSEHAPYGRGFGAGAAAPGPQTVPQPGSYGLHQIMEEAETIISEAQAEADRILNEARVKALSERERLYEVALDQARKETSDSVDPAQSLAIEDLRAAGEALRAACQELEATTQRRLAAVEAQILDLAFQIAERVVGAELDTRPERVVDNVRQALARLAASDATVRLNPADMPVVQQALLELQAERNVGDMLSFEEDSRVERGGCIVVSENGSVDARPSTKFDQLRSMAES